MTSLLCAAAAVMLAQEMTLPSVLARAGVYVNAFHEQLAGIVAEERYVQDAVTPAKRPLVAKVSQHRELLSDLLLVKLPRTREWLQFRDVFEVDGKPKRATSRASPASRPTAAFVSSRWTPTKHS